MATAALILAYCGQEIYAIEVYSLVSRYNFVANSKWFDDVFGHRLESVVNSLPTQEVDVARKRAQSMDVWELLTSYWLMQDCPINRL